ncbi:hypothetical protein COL154_005900 [Colletotrichum chrysophilum]|nr:uncharacterized protein COL26b_005452 [Colletotrichum chrysophilum]KAJ0349818.1 hypothetical protein KNSL1_004456 [Colletotrichum chrysophilum]KAJ0362992.1 hypothetical protein COL154_005900 [Colletotrichum chrysophilum]KAJ0376254.1 hypothetical protein COL26b_005452 [Colletotrichum chrysophilum]
MDSASIPPRLGHLLDSDREHFKMHPGPAVSDARSLPDKAARHALPETARLQTKSTDALPTDAAKSTSGDATANHHHNHNHIHRNHPQHQQPEIPVSRSPYTSHTLEVQPATKTPIASVASSQDHQPGPRPVPSAHSQDSNPSAESDTVFTPPASQGDMPGANTNGHNSSQESQLLQLSHIAAAQDKLLENDAAATSRKRMADGMVKEDTSPVRIGHSRNTSTVSTASTTASSIGDWSSDLKTRLTYAMHKVNHGWQSRSIDEVEYMVSQAASPTSSNSTLHGRQESSASPRANMARYAPASAATTASSGPSPATYESFWKEGQRSNHTSASPPAPVQNGPTLAPPAPIQPARSMASQNPRRNSNPRYTPTLLSHSHSASPHTPGQQNLGATPNQRLGRTPLIDPILFSPHQNVREQDAIESLIFMSSPGNSANMKHNYSQSVASALPGRHALPGSQPRKSLPSQRPVQQKRVGFEKSPSGMTTVSDMDVDMDSPQSRGPIRRRINGSASFSAGSTLRPQLSLPAALGSTSRPRQRLADADIERMIDQAAQAGDSSDDDEGEIQIPSRNRPEGAVGV